MVWSYYTSINPADSNESAGVNFQGLLFRLVAPCNKKGLAIISQPFCHLRSFPRIEQQSCSPCPLPCGGEQRQLHRQLHRTLFGLLRSPKSSGSAQTFKRVKQKCLHFYFRATCLELAQCQRKRGRCSRFASLSGESLRGSREICFLWAFPALSCGSGYILGAIGCAYACRSPPRTKPRYAGLVPKGSLSLTQKQSFLW